jgi:hypothetical protein
MPFASEYLVGAAVSMASAGESDSGVKHFFSGPSRKGTSQTDGDPTLQGHPAAPSLGLCQKSALAQTVSYNGPCVRKSSR